MQLFNGNRLTLIVFAFLGALMITAVERRIDGADPRSAAPLDDSGDSDEPAGWLS